MTGETLEYIYALYKFKSYKTAAESLHISYSCITKQIQRAEEMLGIKLFYKDQNGLLLLTDAGEKIIGPVKKAIAASQEIESLATSFSQGDFGRLNIGFNVRFTSDIVDTALANLLNEKNNCMIHVEYGNFLELVNFLNNDQLDCLIACISEDEFLEINQVNYAAKNNVIISLSDLNKIYLLMGISNPLSLYDEITIAQKSELLKQTFLISAERNGKRVIFKNNIINYLNESYDNVKKMSLDLVLGAQMAKLLEMGNYVYPVFFVDSMPILSGGKITYRRIVDWPYKAKMVLIYKNNNRNNALGWFLEKLEIHKLSAL